jgi:hypothetical protein
LVARRWEGEAGVPTVHSIERRHEPTQEPTMFNRIDNTLIQRSTAFALAAIVTLTLLVSIDGLAARNIAADALLAQQALSSQRV